MGNCCGQKRAALNQNFAGSQTTPGTIPTFRNFPRKLTENAVKLKYTGGTALMLRGPASRKIYNFHGPQVVLEIEQDDIIAIADHPNLIRVI